MPGAVDDHGLVRHRGHVRATRRTRAHHHGHLRDACGRHPRLVEEDAPEVIAVGEDLGLQREEGAPRIHQVDARQAVLEGDLLRAEMLLHGEGKVGAALDGRVVGHDQDLASRDPPDSGDEARRPARRRRRHPRRPAATVRGTASRGRAGAPAAPAPSSCPGPVAEPAPPAPPPSRACARRVRNSATSASMRAALRRNASLRESTDDSSRSMRVTSRSSRSCSRRPGSARRRASGTSPPRSGRTPSEDHTAPGSGPAWSRAAAALAARRDPGAWAGL